MKEEVDETQQQQQQQQHSIPKFVGRPVADLASLEDYQSELDFMNEHMREHNLSYVDMEDEEFQDKWADLRKKIRDEERVLEGYITQIRSEAMDKFQCEKLWFMQMFMKAQDSQSEIQNVIAASRLHHEQEVAKQQQKHDSELAQLSEELQSLKLPQQKHDSELDQLTEEMRALKLPQQERIVLKPLEDRPVYEAIIDQLRGELFRLHYDTKICVRCSAVSHVNDCKHWQQCVQCHTDICRVCVDGTTYAEGDALVCPAC
jgi:hypothetical protein